MFSAGAAPHPPVLCQWRQGNGCLPLRSPHCCLLLSPRDEVNKAYRKLAVLLHPDKCVAPGSEDAFKAVVNARTALLKNIK